MNEYQRKHLPAWLILQFVEAGCPPMEEIVSQMCASYVHSADGTATEYLELRNKIEKRTLDLLLDPSEIWDGLLPGAAIGRDWPQIELVDTDELERLRKLESSIGELGSQSPQSVKVGLTIAAPQEEPRKNDSWLCSIIVNPDIKHDAKTDVIGLGREHVAESPLNLAHAMKKWMEREADKPYSFPVEETCAWISEMDGDQNLIMTWDQALGIVALDEAKERLNPWDDLEEVFQTLYEAMVEAGAIYVAGKTTQNR